MKVFLWIAVGLAVTTLGGAGKGIAPGGGSDSAALYRSPEAVISIQDPQVVRPPRERYRVEYEEMRRAAELAREAMRDIDMERILQEMELAMRQVDLESLQERLRDINFEIDFQDLQFDIPDIDFEIPDIEFDIPDIDVWPEIDVRVPRSLRMGRSGRLELLEMTYQQQGDPGLAYFNEAKTLLFDQKYREAREKFLELVTACANSAYVDDAEFWASYALEQMRGRSEAAFKAYEEFLRKHEESPFVEHARASMVRLAGLLYRQGMEEYKRYIEEAGQDPEDEIRLYALQALVRMEDVDAVAAIEAVLADGSASSRLKREAVDLLRREENPRAVQVMENTAREHADPDVRRRAISALGSRRSREAFDALLRLNENERSVNARRYICDAVGSMRRTDFAAEAAAFLASVVETDPEEDVREQALSELVGFESAVSMTHLKSLLDKTTNPATRRLVLSAISRSEDPGRVDILVREIRTGADERLRQNAVEYLGRVSGPESLDALISIAGSDLPEAVRAKAVDEIGDFEGSKATAALVEIAGSNVPDAVRIEAIDELGNRRVPEAFSALRDIATGQSERTLRERALSELRQWGRDAAPVLEQIALNDTESRIRRRAVSALGRLENGAGWDALVKVYQSDAESRIRIDALDYLWRINEERSIDTVIGAAKSDRDSDLRRHAVQLLGRSESAKAKQALREILNIPPAEVF